MINTSAQHRLSLFYGEDASIMELLNFTGDSGVYFEASNESGDGVTLSSLLHEINNHALQIRHNVNKLLPQLRVAANPLDRTFFIMGSQRMFPAWECLVSRLGTFHSQGGNYRFP